MNELLKNIIGFDWDEGNREKSWIKHKVFYREAEQVFFNKPLLYYDDKHSFNDEQRYQCLGETDGGRKLFISFTIRSFRIRVISTRDQNKKEKGDYEK